MSTTADLLDALGAPLAAFEVPALFSVRLTPSPCGPNVSAQLTCHQPPHIAAGLLAWADTLTDVTITAWRVPAGDCVHLTVAGLLTGGITIEIYGGMPFTTHGIGADLAPRSTATVPLSALHALATLAEVTL